MTRVSMFSIILASVLITNAFGCGQPFIEPINYRVVNGVKARPHSWPWQISLQYQKGESWYHTCGGSIIDTNWVMTAAHCISASRTYRVLVGKHNLSKDEAGSKAISPEKIIVNEKWNPICLTLGNDIALIKLSEPVTLSDSVQLGCIPPAGTVLPNNYTCYVTGWGSLSTEGPMSDTLQQALMPIVDYETCTRPEWWGSNVKKNMVCSGGDGVVAACFGDSGGPLNCKNSNGIWEVHGITSFGFGWSCNFLRKPSVFTRVSAFNDWIDQMMNN